MISLRVASQINSRTGSDVTQSIDEVALYYQATDGEKKKRVYGLGCQSPSYYCIGYTNRNKSNARSSETQNQEELQEMHTKGIRAQNNLITDLRRTI